MVDIFYSVYCCVRMTKLQINYARDQVYYFIYYVDVICVTIGSPIAKNVRTRNIKAIYVTTRVSITLN